MLLLGGPLQGPYRGHRGHRGYRGSAESLASAGSGRLGWLAASAWLQAWLGLGGLGLDLGFGLILVRLWFDSASALIY